MARITHSTWTETSAPRWAGDYYKREALVPAGGKIDAAAFTTEGTVVVTTSAQANAAATSISVNALSGPIPNGTVLDFTGAGEFAKLTSAAITGATSLAVEALDATIESGDTATYTGMGRKWIPAGTLVGRTFAEQVNGDPYGPWASGDNDVHLTAHDVFDLTENTDVDLYRGRAGLIVKENFLPNWATLSSGVKAAIRAAYNTMQGAP